MMLAFLMYLMMQRQAPTPKIVYDLIPSCGDHVCGEEPREYPAIKREQVHMMDWADCPIGFDQGSDVDGRLCTPIPRYTCKSPDTEVLEFTVSGRAFCRKVGQ